MSGFGFWRPAVVGALLGAFIMLPRGDTVLAPLDRVSCERLAEDVRNSRLECFPYRSDSPVGRFIGPVSDVDAGGPTPPSDAPGSSATSVVAAPPVDPTPVNPTPVDPAPVDPAPVDPAPVDPAPVDPAPTDPSDVGDEDPDSRSDANAESDESGSSTAFSGGDSGTTSATTIPGAASCPSTAGSAAVTSDGDVSTQRIAATVGTATRPADVINLASWYLTLPTGQSGSPDTVEYPALANFANEFFKLNDTRDGVVFSARGDGVTTKNSEYPRSELREMNGGEKAAWSNGSGSHVLDVCEAITKLPSAKPEVVAAQIHDGNDDVMQIRLEGRTLMVQYNDGGSQVVIDPDYVLGTPYNVRIAAADGKVDVYYNGQKRVELTGQGTGWYWKVGAYVQSNTSKGDGANAVGEVVVYSLNYTHA